ncbi:hypothetical protein Glo7428_3530 [Gloeocapsa sp. PCC 7428]|uniref:hypothetical protein n=1 Tax=Gloeocapsa sp. PCC 7428 TaxID=1173026 RepID=UPI0002A5ED5D|nr:hypothetical protein [Gloeocapsa sp. PCC 7428]AFZ31999.1 hypothetical protein Glo7428_3530 [Gloeocapsa sp. PCC 7428]
MINLYTVIIKRNNNSYIALCLEAGIQASGSTQEEAIYHLKATLRELEQNSDFRNGMDSAPDWPQQIYEFLVVGRKFPTSEVFELRLIYLE